MNNYIENVVCYIAGYVVKSLAPKIACKTCKSVLELSDHSFLTDYSFLNFKTKGGLKEPSEDVLRICKSTESYYRTYQEGDALNNSKEIMKTIPIRVAVDVCEDIFENLRQHVNNCGPLNNHVCDLTKEVARTYLKIRIRHTVSRRNWKRFESKIRHISTKNVIFQHQ